MAANSRFAVATHLMVALAHLAEHEVARGLFPDGWISSEFLAGSVNTNPVVVRRLLGDLRRAGLIESRTGKRGGARIARRSDAITLQDVYAAVEDGAMFALHPQPPNKDCPVGARITSILEPVFERASSAVREEGSDVFVINGHRGFF